MLGALADALSRGDAEALVTCLREDVVLLQRDATLRGRDEVVDALARRAGGSWGPPRQHGAHALLARRGGPCLLVETRRGQVVLVADTA